MIAQSQFEQSQFDRPLIVITGSSGLIGSRLVAECDLTRQASVQKAPHAGVGVGARPRLLEKTNCSTLNRRSACKSRRVPSTINSSYSGLGSPLKS
jgi:hypothetical protein